MRGSVQRASNLGDIPSFGAAYPLGILCMPLALIVALLGGPGDAQAQQTEAESATEETQADSPQEPTEEAGGAQTPEGSAAGNAEAGRVFYQAGNYVQALGAFKAAYEVTPTAALAYNIAKSHERLSQWKEAIEWYEKYVELETDPRERAEAIDKIALLKEKVGDGQDGQYEALMLSGKKAYSRGNFEGAIEDFQAAFTLSAKPAPLYNMAKSYEKLGRYEDALDFYGQYLELDPNAADRADVEAIMERLRRDIKARFQELSISSTPPGADVYIDDRTEGIIGQTNTATKLRPGTHTIFIDLNGYEPIEREIVMPDDKPLALDFALVKLENVGYITVTVTEAGARIFIDGAIVGLSPFTQKKALEAGEHQLQVELAGYDRHVSSFAVTRGEDTPLAVELKKYDPGVSDGTLEDWGRNLLIVGIAGGVIGFTGPIIYQEIAQGRPYFDELGPENGAGTPFYTGNPDSLRSNSEKETFETIQLVSVIAGGTLALGGLTFYMIKWFRDEPPPPVAADAGNKPSFEITGFGVRPLPQGGGSFGLSGSF